MSTFVLFLNVNKMESLNCDTNKMLNCI